MDFRIRKWTDYPCDTEADGDILQERLEAAALAGLQSDEEQGFDRLAAESAACWQEQVWDRAAIEIEGEAQDQLVLHFARYHLRIMVPAHDNRMNIGAKGLSGEGYKGHTFWDTEIFLLPYYIYTMPEVARSLEEYRYHALAGAHLKAAGNGCQGAQFPWEAAWIDDGETCPLYAGTDIVTGTPIRVWSGSIEIHITADVAFGIWQYYASTGDQDFMNRYGYEVLFDCAKFWVSRLEPGADGKFHIRDVVGSDEYKEHVDDNAFTNYMARWNMEKALRLTVSLREEQPELYRRLEGKLGLDALLVKWEECINRIYLTEPNEAGVLPQDATYLTLPEVDLSKYRNQAHVGGIYKDYNQDQINGMQVSKQADVLVLFYLLEETFPEAVKLASWHYYEPRTLHDSSLSLSTHAVLACDIGDPALGYEMFRKASMIDLSNDNPHSSDAGIHAASYGGLWQAVVYGFGGFRMTGDGPRITPHLPDAWDSLAYTVCWRGQKLRVQVTGENVTVENETGDAPIDIEICGKPYTVRDRLSVAL